MRGKTTLPFWPPHPSPLPHSVGEQTFWCRDAERADTTGEREQVSGTSRTKRKAIGSALVTLAASLTRKVPTWSLVPLASHRLFLQIQLPTDAEFVAGPAELFAKSVVVQRHHDFAAVG